MQNGQSRAVRLAAMILRDCGADVAVIRKSDTYKEDPAIDSRKNTLIFQDITDTRISDLIKRTDILIDDGLRADEDEKLNHHIASSNHLIHCSIPASLENSRLHLNEDTVSAFSGLYESITGLEPPRPISLPLASTVTAFHAVNAITMALIGRERCGRGYFISIPLEKVALSLQVLTLMESSRPPVSWEPVHWLSSPFMGVYKGSDGRFIYIQIGLPRHLRNFLFLIESAGFKKQKALIRRFLNNKTRRDPISNVGLWEAIRITGALRSLFLEKPAEYWEKLLGEAGLCCTMVRSFSEWKAHPQVAKSGEFLNFSRSDGTTIEIPGKLMDSSYGSGVATEEGATLSVGELLQRWTEEKVINSPQSSEILPLQGVRVLDLSRIIAGPLAGRLLAEYGGDVLHLSLRGTHLLWEEPFHVAFNAGKSSVAIDFSRPNGRKKLKNIIREFKPDIVIHNFLEKAAVKLGIDYESLKADFPDVVFVNIMAYKPSGPWKNHSGFEQNIQAASGLMHSYSGEIPVPKLVPMPIIDQSTGLIGSLSAALSYYRRLRGHGGSRTSTNLSISSVYIQTGNLNIGNAKQPESLCGYYKTRDRVCYLSITPGKETELNKIPEFSTISPDKLNSGEIAAALKTRPLSHWQNIIHDLHLENAIQIVERRSMRQILKGELADKTGILRYREHEGMGKVLVYDLPVMMKPGGVRVLPVAEPIGKSSSKHFDDKNAVESRIVAGNRKNSLISYVGWFLGQLRWAAVIIWREINLRR